MGNLPDSLPNGRGLRRFRPRRSVGAFIGHGSRILRLFVSPRPHSTNLLFGTPSSIGSARVWSLLFRLSLAFSPVCSQSLAPTTDPPVSSSTCPGSTSTSSLPHSLDNHGVLACLLTPPAFLATLDISEAYTHIPMRPNLYRYLAFSYLGQLYFFHALPFGLNVAPYIFTQVLAWPLHCLRDRGISLLAYLEDIVIWHRDRNTLLAQVQQVMVFLQDMGFRLNLAKSQPYPSPSAVWLGVHWLPQTGRWHLPVEGQEAIRRAALALLRAPLVTRRQIERLVGVINFACQVHRFLRPFLQPLTKGGTIARAAERDTPAPLPPPMREVLTFWTSPTPWLHVPRFHSDLPWHSLCTDASNHGWGALLQPSLTGSGEWSPKERALHVNVLELRAVLRALHFFDLRHLSLRIYTDNESVRYTLAACRTKSLALRQELIALLSALQARDLTFQVLRVPTALNVVADALSRAEPLNTEWTLPQLSFGAILRWAGPLEVDLMASPINHRLPRWVSAFPHPDALAVDCRSIDWAAFRSLYLFPPSAMLPQLLHRILECPTRLVVVVPWKPHEPWFPPLLQGAVSHLHLRTTPFQLTGSGTVWHSSGTSARWTALLFCGKS